jgi:hypothetical protein
MVPLLPFRRRASGYVAALIGPDRVILDVKYFSAEAAAVRYVTHEGPEAAEGDVATAEIYAPDDKLCWNKEEVKIEDKYGTGSWRSSHLKQYEEYKGSQKKLREANRRPKNALKHPPKRR